MRFSVKSESKLLQTFNIHISATKLSTGKKCLIIILHICEQCTSKTQMIVHTKSNIINLYMKSKWRKEYRNLNLQINQYFNMYITVFHININFFKRIWV